MTDPGTSRRTSAISPTSPSPLSEDDGLTRLCRLDGQLAGMTEVTGFDTAHLQAEGDERLVDDRRETA